MKIKGSNIEILIVLMIILLSKTVFFGIVNKRLTLSILIILLSFIFFKKRKDLSKNTLITFFSISFVLILVTVVHFSNLTLEYIFPVIEFIIYLFGMAIVVTYIEKYVYCNIYISIITTISIISLINYSVTFNFPNSVNFLAQHIQIGDTTFIVSPFYTWGFDSYIYPRNAGPFWEPGAFQGFILIALIMLLYYKNMIKLYKWKILILVLTLITTQSTTGYIILSLICIFFWNDILKLFSVKKEKFKSVKKMFLLPLISICIIFVVYFIFNSDTINNKFNDDNISFNLRLNHFYNSLTLISEEPFFGFGNGPEKTLKESSVSIDDNSVGLLSLIYTYGLFFFIFYSYRFKRGIDSMFPFEGRAKRLCIYIIFIIMFMTQGYYYLPVFILFLYQWPKKTLS